MKIYFATNRQLVRNEGQLTFSDELGQRPLEYRVGHIDAFPGEEEWVVDRSSLRIAPESVQQGTDKRSFASLGSDIIFDQIIEEARREKSGDVLIILHGAAQTFETSIEIGAKCVELYSDPTEQLPADVRVGHISPTRPLVPFVFSYPTSGRSSPSDYFMGRYDASVSGPAIARAYSRWIDFVSGMRADDRCGKRIHLLAHSLGSFALRSAVQVLFESNAMRPIRLFDSIILANADEDTDAFQLDQKLRPLTRLADDVVVYYDRSDKLVRMSDGVREDRLGQKGPPGSTDMFAPGCRISAVDCEATSFDIYPDRHRHRHYLRSRAVVSDIRQVIAGVDPDRITGRHAREGERGFYRLGS